MNKLLLTTYRKLYKLCARVDGNVAARALLLCSPSEVYDHRTLQWKPLKLEKFVDRQDSRAFLDRLVRRINNGSAFFIPPLSEEEVSAAQKVFNDSLESVRTAEAAVLTEKKDATAGPKEPSSATTEKSSKTKEGKTINPHIMIPDFITPYMPLTQALRLSFQRNTFFTAHINNSMAVIKELVACEETLNKHPLLPSEVMLKNVPEMTTGPLTKMSHVTLFGLTEEMRENFQQFDKRTSKGIKASQTVEISADTSTENEDKSNTENQKDDDAASVSANANPTKKTDFGEHVQLLISHPRLNGFFRSTVMLVVRHSEHEAAAFVINKALVDENGEPMRIGTNTRLRYIPEIFKKHLMNHTIMLGGPVMTAAFDDSLFLLHSIRDVPKSIQISEGLFLDGDTHVISEKIESGEAKTEDIIVLCGLAGWSEGQLEGELRSGTWIPAKGSSADEKTNAFVHYIANCAGSYNLPAEVEEAISHSDAQGKGDSPTREGAPAAEARAEETEGDDDPEAVGTLLDDGDYEPHSRPVYKPQVLSWALACHALPKPLSELAKSQVHHVVKKQ